MTAHNADPQDEIKIPMKRKTRPHNYHWKDETHYWQARAHLWAWIETAGWLCWAGSILILLWKGGYK